MKVEKKIVTVPPAFEPVQLNLTFETKDELARFFAIFNHVDIGDLLGRKQADLIRNQIMDIVNNDYLPYHQKLCKLMK